MKANCGFRCGICERAVAVSSAGRRPFAVYRFFMPPGAVGEISLSSYRSQAVMAAISRTNEILPGRGFISNQTESHEIVWDPPLKYAKLP